VDHHLQQLVGRQRLGRGDAPGGVQAGREPGDRGLAHLGEGVVGAGGQPGDRQWRATAGGGEFPHHRAVGAVTAQHHDRGGAGGLQQAGGGERVLHRGGGVEVQPGDLGQRGVAAAQVALQQRADAAAVGHQQRAGHAGGARGLQHAQHDVDAVGDLQVAGVGHDAADVARRHRVGDDAETGV
jgi:hypothetical protein